MEQTAVAVQQQPYNGQSNLPSDAKMEDIKPGTERQGSTDVPVLTLSEWQNIINEIRWQPAWRRECDIIADYFDGNQLDSETLQAMEELGMAPIIENLMAPAINSVLGLEVKNRLDFMVTADHDDSFSDAAEAINMKLNEAERRSKADRACSKSHAAQAKVGIGFVLVGMESDPFKFPHKTEYVHRNECFWDWASTEPDLSDARYFVRRKWYDTDILAVAFPKKAELLRNTASGWAAQPDLDILYDGGMSTGLKRDYALESDRAWTTLEYEWREIYRQRLCLSEVWYRRWVNGFILRTPDGRVVEYDDKNPAHVDLVKAGVLQKQQALFTKTRLSWWVGPHCLADMPNPYKHNRFPYVPFWGEREDMTGVPYGLGRAMKSLQDEINARNTKMHWLLTAKRIIMTEGVTDLEKARAEAARPDAVHELDPDKMRNGGMFKVESDFQLNAQQYQSLVDKREALKNVAAIYKAFEGQNSNASSGLAINNLVEQSTQSLATLNDNFQFGRNLVGELLLSNVIQEMGSEEMQVVVKGGVNTPAKPVVLNQKTDDGKINNDIQRIVFNVALSDVPSTASYRKQRYMMLSELAKSLPPQLQAVVLPYVMAASDEPERDQIIKDIQKALGQPDTSPPKTPEEAAQRKLAEDQAQAQAQNTQELQDSMAMSELERRKAETEKMQAETNRINAEAKQVFAEVQKALKELSDIPERIQAALISADTQITVAGMRSDASHSQQITAAAVAHLAEERREEEGGEASSNQQGNGKE